MGVDVRYNSPVESMKALLGEHSTLSSSDPARRAARISTSPDDTTPIVFTSASTGWSPLPSATPIQSARHVLIIGVGNTAMDCCRTSRRLGGKDIKVMARRPRGYFKASPWELEDSEEEGVEILINHAPKQFVLENGKLAAWNSNVSSGMREAKRSKVIDTVFLPADDVILAIGQENAFPWIERDLGH